ncbi:MAG: HNH endonuclease [Paraglaciecola sp.]|uniref:HNH endonuclease n=2 Tax=Paraglaciecola sp. TaxID=1920173 RepID=UPI003265A05B
MASDLALVHLGFKQVEKLSLQYGDSIPHQAISEGFFFNGEKVLLDNRAVGIFKPRQMFECAMSIKTTMQRDGTEGIYNDHHDSGDHYKYALQRGDPYGVNNKYLWASMNTGTPVIYFQAIAPGRYTAIWPCFVKEILPEKGYALIVESNKVTSSMLPDHKHQLPTEIESRYCVRETKVRMHQASFRQNVLDAYSGKCAITGLPNKSLLEAAHIIPDLELGKTQYVSDGIALSRIHHRAYDLNLLGISPDNQIHISDELKQGKDNKFIRDALLEFEGRKLVMPRSVVNRPDREKLAARFEVFLGS